MMKFLSVIGFAVVMTWTWVVINSESSISLETHVGIQNRLSLLIQESILSKIPQASNIRIEDLWTEPTGRNGQSQITAHFSYRYDQPGESTSGKADGIRSELAGEAILEPQPDDGSGVEKWALKEFKSSSDAIFFREPLVIATGENAPQPGLAPTTPSSAGVDSTAAPVQESK